MTKTAERGQATVEVIALLPLVVAVAAAVVCVLAAGAASGAASAAAQAGALAVLQDRDPAAAARRALGSRPRGATRIRIRGGEVQVSVRPRLPLASLEGLLEASATARAGDPDARHPVEAPRGGDGRSGGHAP